MEAEPHKALNFFELCRLCLHNHGLTDIFELENLVEDIKLCTGVKIRCSDNLPQKICMRCLDVVVKARRLRDQAATNDKHLKSLFGNDGKEKGSDKTEKENNETNTHKDKNQDENDLSDSSFDSDSPRLQIDEGDCNSRSETNKRRPSVTPDNDKKEIKKISVRTDLFDSTVTKTSPTQDIKPVAKKPRVKCKIKKGKGESVTYYECEECGKNFYTWKKFYLHQRSHNRKIICPLDACEKKFATKGDLEKHIRTHTGERPYGCEVCGKRFTQRGSLKNHRDTVHSSDTKQYIIK
ncbi:unnamed protein product [Chrysodeixis includens]|uniref:Uncharacterized protein n=1 Tax=Chrysodeixis includens TaxID=689277 RepID=A0A9P0BYI3_CHRIL|nr:unnamed protein product [Chrysodeixis includens]